MRLVVRLTLENISDVTVGRLHLNFSDSIQEVAEQESHPEIPISDLDAFDLDWDLKNRPVFSLPTLEDFGQLGPSQTTSVAITCVGKSGW
jgi:hypothetical protein